MPDLSKQYEVELQKAIRESQKKIRKLYEESVVEISLKAAVITLLDKPFRLSLYPLLDRFITSKMKGMQLEIYRTIVKGIADSWDLSNTKNDAIVDKRLASKEPTERARQILYDPNIKAKEAFIKRVEKGMSLSKRVWRALKPFRAEMEQGLGITLKTAMGKDLKKAIGEGVSATKLATEMKKYLDQPDKLFRRVRTEDGKLALSKTAREYHPGQGVYRSSYKNALRLTRSENNLAYRTADWERWQKLPFVIGIEVKLSKQHPKYDICDTLVGKYPRKFVFPGWHPQCICYQVPILMSKEQYEKYEDQILGIGKLDEKEVIRIEKPPAAFDHWLEDNRDRIKGWKNPPYWVSMNGEFTASILQ